MRSASTWGLVVATSMCSATAAAEQPSEAHDPSRADRSGWVAFGAESGVLIASAATAGFVAIGLSEEDGGEPMWVALPAMALGLGLPILGGWGLGQLGRSGEWDPDVGWGAAGVWPGVALGASLAVGCALIVRPDPPDGSRLGIAALGAAVGGALGYLLFEAAAESRGHAGWHLLASWAGMLMGTLIGFAARDAGTNAFLPLVLGPAVSAAAFGTAHLLTW